MPKMTAIFGAQDEISKAFDNMSKSGRKVLSMVEDLEGTISKSFSSKPAENFSSTTSRVVDDAVSNAQDAFSRMDSSGSKAFADIEGNAASSMTTAAKVADEAASNITGAVENAAGNSQKAFADISSSGIDAFSQVEKAADGMSSKITGAMSSMKSGMGTVAAVGASLLGALALDQIYDGTVGINATLEQQQVAYENITGSAEKAIADLSAVTALAAATPFETQDLIQAGKVVEGIGGDFSDNLTNIGNMAAAMGVDVTNAADAVRDTLGSSLESVEGRLGIPKKRILEWMKANNQLEGAFDSKGIVLDYDKARDALMAFADANFGGAMEKQSQTMNGLLSTLSDSFVMFGQKVGSKFFDKVKGGIQGTLDNINKLSENGTLDEWADKIGTAIGTVFEVVGNIKTTVGDALKEVPGLFDQYLKPALATAGTFFDGIVALAKGEETPEAFATFSEDVQGTLVNMFGEKLGGEIATTFDSLWTKVTGTMDQVKEGFPSFANSLKENLIGAAVNATPILENLGILFSGIFGDAWGAQIGLFGKIAAKIPTIVDTVATKFQELEKGISPLIATMTSVILTISDLFYNNLAPAVGDVLGTAIDKLLIFGSFAVGILNQYILPFINQVVQGFQANILPIITDVINVLTTTIFPILNDALDFITTTVLPILQSAFDNIFPHIQSVVENVFTIISAAWNNVLKPVIDAIVVAFQFAWPFIKGVVEGAITTITNLLGGLWSTIDGVITFITGVFTGDWDKAWTGVKDIFKGIFETIGSLVKQPLNTVIGILNGVIDNINGMGITIPDWVPYLGGESFTLDIPKMDFLADGTDFWKGGKAIIGEAGPELVTGPTATDLAPGSQVLSADDTADLLNGQGNTSNTTSIQNTYILQAPDMSEVKVSSREDLLRAAYEYMERQLDEESEGGGDLALEF